MKKIYSLLISLCLVSSLKAQIQQLEFEYYELAQEGKYHEIPEDSLLLIKKEVKVYDDFNRISSYTLYKANPIGELVKHTEKLKTWENGGTQEDITSYDEMGDKQLRQKNYYVKRQKTKVEFIDYIKFPNQQFNQNLLYTDFKKPLKVTTQNTQGKKVAEEKWKYNSNEEEVLYKKWDKRSEVKYKETKKTSYQDNGMLDKAEQVIKDKKGTTKIVTLFQRNKIKEQTKYLNGKVTSEFNGRQGGFDPSKAKVLVNFDDNPGGGSSARNRRGGGFNFGAWETEDELDEKGNKVKTSKTLDEELIELTTYKYDDQNNLLETQTIFYNQGEETDREIELCEYDDKNNKISQKIYKNKQLIMMQLYKYTYK